MRLIKSNGIFSVLVLCHHSDVWTKTNAFIRGKILQKEDGGNQIYVSTKIWFEYLELTKLKDIFFVSSLCQVSSANNKTFALFRGILLQKPKTFGWDLSGGNQTYK